MSKDKLAKMLNDSEIKLTEEWKVLFCDIYRAIFGNGESIFSQLREFKEEVKNHFNELKSQIQMIDNTVDQYIDTENNYKVKFERSQADLEIERQRVQTERFWKFIILIIGPLLGGLIAFGIDKLF